MSKDLNESFMKDPHGFFKKYVVDVSYNSNLSKSDMASGLCAVKKGPKFFDLTLNAEKKYVEVTSFEEPNGGDSLIPGYWLPWLPKAGGYGGVAKVDFADVEQDYIFTSQLSGCRILMTDKSFSHIAGDSDSAWRQEKSEGIMGAENSKLARTFSSTSLNKYQPVKSNVTAAVALAYKFNGKWNMVGQSFGHDSKNRYKKVKNYANGKFKEIRI